jgi:hypothetical protein
MTTNEKIIEQALKMGAYQQVEHIIKWIDGLKQFGIMRTTFTNEEGVTEFDVIGAMRKNLMQIEKPEYQIDMEQGRAMFKTDEEYLAFLMRDEKR